MVDLTFWKRKKVLITGATGFIGNALVERLLTADADVSAIVRTTDFGEPFFCKPSWQMRSVRTFTGDVRDYQLVQRAMVQAEPDVIFHLAAVTQVVEAKRMPLETYQTNILGTVNVLEATRDAAPEASVIVASSDKAYGRQEGMASNQTPHNPHHPYDASKAAAEIVALSYARHYSVPLSITRMSNIYGPGDRNWRRIIPGTVRSILRREEIVLRSDGKQVRDYLYIDDAVDGYLTLAQFLHTDGAWVRKSLAEGVAFNFAGQSANVLDIVRLISATMRYAKEPVILGQALDETPILLLDDMRTRDLLGWEPKVSLPAGIDATIAWLAKDIRPQRKELQ